MAQVDVSPCFKKLISQYDIVEFLLSLDPYLKATYDFYQTIMPSNIHHCFFFKKLKFLLTH